MRSAASAVTMPSVMLAPVVFETTAPPGVIAAATSAVTVLLPLVPVTTTLRRSPATARSTSGSTRRASRPPIMEPEPLPRACDSRPADRPVASARRARSGSRA